MANLSENPTGKKIILNAKMWSLTLLLFSFLIAIQAITSGEFYVVYLICIPLIFYSYRIWTDRGKRSIFSLSNFFPVYNDKLSKIELAVWIFLTLLISLMWFGYIKELFQS
jgi:hypothetical protein